MKKKTVVLIVAAGSGERSSSSLPKQYTKLGTTSTVLQKTLEQFLKSNCVDAIRVVINRDHLQLYEQSLQCEILAPAIGGARRQDSVRIGLESLAELQPDFVIIHDGCRPFFSASIIPELLSLLDEHHGAAPVLFANDTLKLVQQNKIIGNVDRNTTGAVQTPQAFRYQDILWCHREQLKRANDEVTDDSSLLQMFNLSIGLAGGERRNFKITTPEDLNYARLIAGEKQFKVGSGYDIHRFVDANYYQDNFVVLCGIKISCEKIIEAHSDGDVVLHALTDAILGALACGDIGEHFPPSDIKWKGADSRGFLKFARQKMREKGFSLSNADITIICEFPKITPYKKQMRDSVAALLQTDSELISIKATTAEKLGAIGRGDGIAAHAMVSLVAV